jgi:dTDP-4-amino-4,6-dideoxygalactose transaminase
MIPVTKPFLPPEEEYKKYIDDIWRRWWITNNGPLVNDLEIKLKNYLGVDHLLFLCNGTVALQLAIKALNIKKDVITTPFSYVATTSSLVWENCNPVFVDIDPNTLNLDPQKIEDAISENTEAILATHCFGNPCDVEAIQEIADQYRIKVIYDAAHCFGTTYKGGSIFKWGDISTCSFHATKPFHTIEGGAVFTNDPDSLQRMAYQRNFGHDGPEKFNGVGINAKNSEFHAAMGVCILEYINEILENRRDLKDNYDRLLQKLDCFFPTVIDDAKPNNAYYPVIFPNEKTALKMKEELEKLEIFPRRYFYPTLNHLDYVNSTDAPIAENIASRILCLPLYPSLTFEEQETIARVLLRTQNYKL